MLTSRRALGATAGDIVKVVVRRSAGLAVAGSAIGLLAPAGAARFAASMAYGVSPYDAVTFAAAAAALVAISRPCRLQPGRPLRARGW